VPASPPDDPLLDPAPLLPELPPLLDPLPLLLPEPLLLPLPDPLLLPDEPPLLDDEPASKPPPVDDDEHAPAAKSAATPMVKRMAFTTGPPLHGCARETFPRFLPYQEAAPVVGRPMPLGAEGIVLSPNVLAVKHWDRLLGGALYAATARVDWATLLRRSFDVDVLACAQCGGRLRVRGEVTDAAAVRLVLESLGLPTDAPRAARARDPTDLLADQSSD
jgi:hypothetical protein